MEGRGLGRSPWRGSGNSVGSRGSKLCTAHVPGGPQLPVHGWRAAGAQASTLPRPPGRGGSWHTGRHPIGPQELTPGDAALMP